MVDGGRHYAESYGEECAEDLANFDSSSPFLS